MPLGIKKVRKPNLQKQDSKKESRKAALRLIQFEKKLFSDNINKKQKRKKNREIIASDTSSDHLKSKERLELNSIIDTIDSKSDSIDSTANMKANLQDIDADIPPLKKQRKRNEEVIVSGTSDNLKNRNHLELNSVMDTTDSKSDSIDSSANIKTNLHNADADILSPVEKHKRKKNGETIASDTSPDNLKNRDYSELNSIIDTINSKSDSSDSIANIKVTSQDTDASIMLSKKQKCNLTYNKFDDKHVIEDKKKLKIRAHRKLNKTKKIKLNQMGDTFMTDNLKCKPKKMRFHEKHTFNKEQHTFISPLLKKKNLLEKTMKNKKSLVLKKTILEKNVTHNDQGMLKDVRSII